jgi:hypothetical protein
VAVGPGLVKVRSLTPEFGIINEKPRGLDKLIGNVDGSGVIKSLASSVRKTLAFVDLDYKVFELSGGLPLGFHGVRMFKVVGARESAVGGSEMIQDFLWQ